MPRGVVLTERMKQVKVMVHYQHGGLPGHPVQ